MDGAAPMVIGSNVRLEPGPPAPFPSDARPICSIADEQGEDISYGILLAADGDGIELIAAPFVATAATIRIGRIWAEPVQSEWRLLGKLSPAWAS